MLHQELLLANPKQMAIINTFPTLIKEKTSTGGILNWVCLTPINLETLSPTMAAIIDGNIEL